MFTFHGVQYESDSIQSIELQFMVHHPGI